MTYAVEALSAQFEVGAVKLGDTNQDFAWLEDSFRAHNEGLTNLKIDPCQDSLRSDPRFEDLVLRVGLPVN